jgi:hypothetical protein
MLALGRTMSQPRNLIGLSAALVATAAMVPVLLSAYRRSRRRDYTTTPEFRALVGGYLI